MERRKESEKTKKRNRNIKGEKRAKQQMEKGDKE